jgi:outer membrane protein assembly factor BamB
MIIDPRLNAYILQATKVWDPRRYLSVESTSIPEENHTLCNIDPAVKITGPETFPLTILIQPYDPSTIYGINLNSVRFFYWNSNSRLLQPIWDSGINTAFKYIWAKIRKSGIYVPIGLPRDKLVQEMIRIMAYQHFFTDTTFIEEKKTILKNAITLFTSSDNDSIYQWRRNLTVTEIQTTLENIEENNIRIGGGGTVSPFPFPKIDPSIPRNEQIQQFKERLGELTPTNGELPEESLLLGSPTPVAMEPRWPIIRPGRNTPMDIAARLESPPISFPVPFPLQYLCWFQAPDWRGYHHDEGLTGVTTGCSSITSNTVGNLMLYKTIELDGPVIGTPSVVRGKIYVGTGNSKKADGGLGGTLYKIDLYTGIIENEFTFSTPFGQGSRQSYAGIGSSPAVFGGRVYFSGMDGQLYSLDDTTLKPIWITDLRNPDFAHNQPVQNYSGPNHGAEGWSSPLFVNGRIYVGFGEGESEGPNNYGFIYCLDADTGNVMWLFCTNQFVTNKDNEPNIIPPSCVPSESIPPKPYKIAKNDPLDTGASPWSSCSYDRKLNRIYIGTGNALKEGQFPEGYTPLPESKYASGVLSLDANTGQFKGFFQPSLQDCYRDTDIDIDVPAGPMLFTQGTSGKRILAIGSKNGSFFLLDAETLQVIARRQLLPYDSSGKPFPDVDKEPEDADRTHPESFYHENYSGIFGTATVHYGFKRLFVGLGGYRGTDSIEFSKVPFMRAVDWDTLEDAWSTSGNNPPKYTTTKPPMYTNAGETGYSSPAIVNDVVMMSTSQLGLYAFDAATGLCLWSAEPASAPGTTRRTSFMRGPVVYGDSVVIGTMRSQVEGSLKIYRI